MGATTHNGTMVGAVTPICNECGVFLCWDIDIEEYEEEKAFWNDWICYECNGGVKFSKQEWLRKQR